LHYSLPVISPRLIPQQLSFASEAKKFSFDPSGFVEPEA
jgi:hypothetical protein